MEHLHDEAAVLVVDETGDVKKGTQTIAVQRQYTGTAGHIENSQVAAYRVHAGERGHAAVDRGAAHPALLDLRPGSLPAAGLAEDTVGIGYVLAVACSAETTTSAGLAQDAFEPVRSQFRASTG